MGVAEVGMIGLPVVSRVQMEEAHKEEVGDFKSEAGEVPQ